MALTLGMLPLLRKAPQGARVVCLSSTAHIISGIRWDDIHFHHSDYDKWKAYGQSKSANSLFAVELDAREQHRGVRAYAVHPGGIFTPLQRHLAEEEMIALGWKNPDGSIPDAIRGMFKSPEAGAATTVLAATSPALSEIGGVYLEDCDIAALGGESAARFEKVRPWAVDSEQATRLWALSEAMLDSA
jgi:NAD(P)-dependent dehydrogenase (short-subunit alcohol dehydrogenase family)